jgi:hypothetical protein
LYQKSQADGWIVDKGYQVNYYSKRVMKYSKLSRICGSTFILSRNLVGVPQAYTSEEYGKCIYSQGHQTMENFFLEKGFKLRPISFHAVQYILNHNINDSLKWRQGAKSQIKKILKFWIIGDRMKPKNYQEFGYI